MLISIRGRLAFPSLWTPSSINGGPEKYRARVIIDPNEKAFGKPAVKLLDETYLAVAEAKWQKKGAGILAATKGDKNKGSWFKSDYINPDTGEAYDGFEDMYHLSALADVQPTILDADRTELTKRDGRPYSGCYCVFKLDIWAQDNTNGKAVRAGLAGVQFWKDGDNFGGGVKAKVEDFEDLSDQGDEPEADDEKPAPKAKAKPKPSAADDADDMD